MTTSDSRMTGPRTVEVLIAGAGPAGLLLACELALAGCTVLVIEQAADPHAPTKVMPFGLRGLSVPTIELLDRRGLLDALRDAAAARDTVGSTQSERRGRRHGGHFAGIDVFYDTVPDDAWPYRLPGAIESLGVDMATIEAVLATRATSLGVDIRRGESVRGVEQTADGVVVTTDVRSYAGRWLVGCDGGRSTVRKAASIGFTGTAPEFTGYSVQVTLADPSVLPPGRTLAPGGVVIYAPPGTIWMADFDGGAAHRTVPLTREHVEAVLRRVSGFDIVVSSLDLATTWTDRACLAERYRNGRVLLAGDAAHVHSPLGGQGLNLGLGDAMNLGWKLGAVVRGDASADLLDSYERERRPVAAQILDRSRAQVALLRPDPGSRALESAMRDLIGTREGTARFAERISGIGIRYDLGGTHPLVGRSVPDFALVGGTRVHERLREGRGLLLVFAGRVPPALAGHPSATIRCLAGVDPGPLDVSAALVRPDGIVEWAATGTVDMGEIEAAIDGCFFEPNAHP